MFGRSWTQQDGSQVSVATYRVALVPQPAGSPVHIDERRLRGIKGVRMSVHLRRRPMALAAVLAIGALFFVALPTADASYSGAGTVLSASNGSPQIRFADGSALTVPVAVTDASWSPDGSRAVFVFEGGSIGTVRHNDGDNAFYL